MKRISTLSRPANRVLGAFLTLPLAAGTWAADAESPQADPQAGEPAAATPAEAQPDGTAPEATPDSAPPGEAAPGEAEAEASGEKEAEAEPEAEAEAAESASGDLKNWVQLGAGGTFIDGHKPAFQQRYGLPDGAFGGVDGFHYEQGFAKDGLFQVDGRGIFDEHDYALKLDFDLPDKGFFRVGYSEDRIYSDGSGGYFPPTQAWYSLYPDTLAYDDREIYVEAGVRLPKIPKFTFRYAHTEREGQKDSTVWGASGNTGGLGTRNIVPTLLELDRVRDLVMADLAHTFGVTQVGLGVRYERQDNNDARLMRQYPGEGAGLDRHVTQRDQTTADMFNVHAHTVSRFNSKMTFSAGYAYTDLNTDISGYRRYGLAFDPDLAQRLPASSTFDNLVGGATVQQHVGNLNFMANLTDKLVLVPSLRIESRDTEGNSLSLSPAAPFAGTPYLAESERGLLDVSEGLDLRYTGLTNWVFYAKGYWLQGSGDLEENRLNQTTSALVMNRETDDQRFAQKYTAGANWYPWRRLSFGAEYYHKRRDNDFDHSLDSTSNLIDSPNRYSAFLRAQSFITDDVNFRVTWRPRNNLSVIGRYDMQLSTIDTQPDNLPEIQTSDMTSYIGSGSISWVPFTRVYLLGSLSYVWDRTTTPASDLTPAVLNAENTYWTGNATVGYALDDKTDLEGQYLFYRADNYEDNSAFGQPYGAGGEDHGVTAGIVRRMSKRVRVSLKYGFFTSHDELSGGNRDYDAHMLYSTVQYRF